MPTEDEIVAAKIESVTPKKVNAFLERPEDSSEVGSAVDDTTIDVLNKDYRKLYGEFGIDQHSPKLDEIFKLIWQWGSDEGKTKDSLNIIHQVGKLKGRLGGVGLSEAPYMKILNYIKVSTRLAHTKQMLKEIENG